MELILLEDVPNLGNMGDLVTVKPGYGRNFLIPKGLAVLATAKRKRELEHRLREIEKKKEKLRGAALEQLGQFDNLSITIPRQVGEEDKLFGSVTNRDIEAALQDLGIDVTRRQIIVKQPLRQLGIYEIPVKLHADVMGNVRVWVVAA